MSQIRFQAELAEMVAGTAAGFRAGEELTALDARRLTSLASQPGIGTMRTLYYSWRLTKVLSLLPLTTRALGSERLAASLRSFWQARRATSLYFVDECIAFLDFVADTLLHNELPSLYDVVAFERARLQLRCDQAKGIAPTPQRVQVHHELTSIINALNAGADLSNLPLSDELLIGELSADGQESWQTRHFSGSP